MSNCKCSAGGIPILKHHPNCPTWKDERIAALENKCTALESQRGAYVCLSAKNAELTEELAELREEQERRETWIVGLAQLTNVTPKDLVLKLSELEQQLAEIRDAVAIYMRSEGCSCCRDSNHDEHQSALGKLLGFPKYEDDSGYDYHVVAEAALLKQGGEG